MVIVLGSVTIEEKSMDRAIELSLEHVKRSRSEPGCLSHGVHVDTEDATRLVFVERWQDMDALQQHFRVPEAGAFVKALSQLATSDPKMEIFMASDIPKH